MKDTPFTADRLLALYDRVAEAEDAIPRLRRLVLDLAARGKLVEQDPNDEPAAELLKRIAKEKARLVKAGEIAVFKSINLPSCSDLAFAIPSHWQPVFVANILNELQTGPFGSSLHQSDYRVGGTPVVNPASIQNERIVPIEKMAVGADTLARLASFKLKSGDIVMARRGEMGRCAVVSESEVGWLCGTGSLILRPSSLLDARFLVLVIGSPFGRDYLGSSSVGATMQNLNQTILLNLPLGLPPLAEQQRIVAKVDELMGLCDRLQAARAGREAVRDRLTAATLARLTAPETDAESFPTHAGFALQALPTLTTREGQIKTLRQTILNLAVRGKLVAQDAADEPASMGRGQTKVEAPFPIPSNWRWATLKSLGKLVGGGTPSKARSDFWGGNIPWVSPKDMKLDHIYDAQMGITLEAISSSSVNMIPENSLLFVVRGMILAHSFPVAIAKERLTINQDMKAISLHQPEMAEYMLRALKGLKPEMLSRVQRSSHGTGRIEGADYSEFPIPLPPLAEQHRIVARVDALMALCDQLEASLTTATTTRSRLLEALLHEALGGAPGDQAEAAA